MDPNATLARIRAIRKELSAMQSDSYAVIPLYNEMEELITALDNWLSDGNFLPNAWQDARP